MLRGYWKGYCIKIVDMGKPSFLRCKPACGISEKIRHPGNDYKYWSCRSSKLAVKYTAEWIT